MGLNGQVALVTGSRGIGGACVRRLAELGATVIVTYKNNHTAAEELVQTVQSKGGQAECIQSNVLDFEQTTNLVKYITGKYQHLDIMVSNAAVGWMEKIFHQLSWEDYIGVVSNELKAAFDLTQAILPVMRQQKNGRLIYMASNLATHVIPDTIASSTAKAALVAFMRNIAFEYGPNGITANAVAPAMVSTEHNQYLPHAALEAITAYTPLRRIATPEDVAGAVAFLAGDDGKYMTGSYLLVDGGKTLSA